MSSSSTKTTQVYGAYLVRTQPAPSKILSFESDLSSFGFFSRFNLEEFLLFSAQTIAERTERGVRHTVKCNSSEANQHFDANLHVFSDPEGLCCVVITHSEYPARIAYLLIEKCLSVFRAAIPKSVWQVTTAKRLSLAPLKQLLQEYQDPTKVDPLAKMKAELDETKIIVHHTIESVLNRGEKLETLVQKSEQLSIMSKAFYKDSKKANACCSYLS